MKTTKVLAIGTRVDVGDKDPIVATIQAVVLRYGGYVLYECDWWDGRQKRSEWLTPSEIRPHEDREMQVGFTGQQ